VAVGAVNTGVAVHSIVALAPAAPIVGACESTCVIVCDTVAELLPQASTATHVLVVVFVQLLPPVTSEPTWFTVTALQASVAVGAVKTGVAVHSIVALAPAAPIVGACVSTCVIVCDTVAELLPQASTATHVLVVVFVQLLPPVTSEPTWFTVTALQASVAVGAVKTGVAVHSIVAFAPAAPITGACVSTCVIVCDTVADVLPQAPLLPCSCCRFCTIIATSYISTNLVYCNCITSIGAVGAVKTGVAVHSIVALAPAAPITGACVSSCVIVCDTVADVLPQASTATHVLVVVLCNCYHQ
jgi:hypothetical protein